MSISKSEATVATTKRTRTTPRWKTTAIAAKLQHQLRQQQHQQQKQKQQQQQQQNLHSHQSRTIFVTNLHQSVTVDDLYELFDFRSTNYLRNNYHVEMDHFSNADQPFASAIVTGPAHVCEELLKLHCINFHNNPLVIKKSKSPLEKSNHYSQSPLQPPPIQRVIHSYGNAVNSKRKDTALFADSIPKCMRMKGLNCRKIYLKSFPDTKGSQLNHYIIPILEEYKYVCEIIHVGINDIHRNKNDIDLNNLPGSILEMANPYQNYNIGKYSSRLYCHQSRPNSIFHKSVKS